MADAFKLYETSTEWIIASENFVNIKTRKENSKDYDESIKKLQEAVKLLEEKEKPEGSQNVN